MVLFSICVYLCAVQCVFKQKNVSRWKPPISKESTTLLLLWQLALSPWALHASNQSETFVEIPQGSTYSTYPTGKAFTLKRLEQREERLPHHSLVWHQTFGATGSGYWELVAKNCKAHCKSKNGVAAPGHGQFQWKLYGIGFVIGNLRASILGKYHMALALV